MFTAKNQPRIMYIGIIIALCIGFFAIYTDKSNKLKEHDFQLSNLSASLGSFMRREELALSLLNKEKKNEYERLRHGGDEVLEFLMCTNTEDTLKLRERLERDDYSKSELETIEGKVFEIKTRVSTAKGSRNDKGSFL